MCSSDLVVDHHAVGAAVEPAGVGVARDVVAAGADIAPAVVRVPQRRGEFRDVDVVALEHVLEDRPVVADEVDVVPDGRAMTTPHPTFSSGTVIGSPALLNLIAEIIGSDGVVRNRLCAILIHVNPPQQKYDSRSRARGKRSVHDRWYRTAPAQEVALDAEIQA